MQISRGNPLSAIFKLFSGKRLQLFNTYLSDRRLSFKYGSLESYIIVRNNHMVWDENEKQKILNRAIDMYLGKRRSKQVSADLPGPS